MFKLNRIQTFFIGIVIIFLFYIVNRGNKIIGAEQINGELLYYVSLDATAEKQLEIYPVIGFEYDKKAYTFYGREGAGYEKNKIIPLLIKNKNTKEPIICTLETFWLYPLFYCLLPLAVWAAFSLSYIDKKEELLVNLKYPFLKKEIKISPSNTRFIS